MRISIANKNMPALPATNNRDLACPIPILENPLGYVGVSCNTSVVPIAEDLHGWAFFSRDGGQTAVKFRDLQAGDRLHWNPYASPFWSWWLAGNESFSFHYLTDEPEPGPIVIEGTRLPR